jgi:hypothetical protein
VGTKHEIWRWPQFIPDRAIVFGAGASVFSFGFTASVAAAGLDGGGAEKDLISGGTVPRLAATGDLIYARNGTLMAVPFNSKRLELAGSLAPVAEGIRESILGAAQYDISASGTLVYVPGRMQGSSSRLVGNQAGENSQHGASPGVHLQALPGRAAHRHWDQRHRDRIVVLRPVRGALSRAALGTATVIRSGRPTATGLYLIPTGRDL